MDTCPACSSAKLQSIGLDYSGPVITSDFMVLQDARLRPFVCGGCGLVFESCGVRRASRKFYAETFRPKPMMKVYDRKGAVSRPAKANALIAELMPDLPARGHMVEIGSGKGDFLRQFFAEHPGWGCVGIEPSILYGALSTVIGVTTFHGGYEQFRCEPNSQDLIVSLGVIEHVDNPLAFLRWIAAALKSDGRAFLEAPNFAASPGDLLCADHLSKLTRETVEAFGRHVGLEPVAFRDFGVPMYLVLRKAGDPAELASTSDINGFLAGRNGNLANGMIDAIARAHAASLATDERFAIFGLAIPGLFAPLALKFPPERIAAYIDDNAALWGTQAAHDRPICGPDAIKELGIRHVALSMSPRYASSVAERVEAMGVEVYR